MKSSEHTTFAVKVWTVTILVAGLLILNTFRPAVAHEITVDQYQWRQTAKAMEWKYALPRGMLLAVLDWENRGQHWRNVIGSAGEIGIGQIKPSTVKYMEPNMYAKYKATYKIGSRGEDIIKIQTALYKRGLYSYRIDGIFGPITRRGVSGYQHSVGLPVTGTVNAITWRRLLGNPYPNRTIKEALWDPLENIELAAKHLAVLQNKVGGDASLIFAAYNAGTGNQVIKYVLGVRRMWILDK